MSVLSYSTYYPGGYRCWSLTLGRLMFSSYDWSLSWHTSGPMWQHIFSLKCCTCRRWTLGCSKHWLCDLCEPCRQAYEKA